MAAILTCEKCSRTVGHEIVIRVKNGNGKVLHFCEPDCLVNWFIRIYKLALTTELKFEMPKQPKQAA